MKCLARLGMLAYGAATVLVIGGGLWALGSTSAHATIPPPKRLCDLGGGPSGCPPVYGCYYIGCAGGDGACQYYCPPQY